MCSCPRHLETETHPLQGPLDTGQSLPLWNGRQDMKYQGTQVAAQLYCRTSGLGSKETAQEHRVGNVMVRILRVRTEQVGSVVKYEGGLYCSRRMDTAAGWVLSRDRDHLLEIQGKLVARRDCVPLTRARGTWGRREGACVHAGLKHWPCRFGRTLGLDNVDEKRAGLG